MLISFNLLFFLSLISYLVTSNISNHQNMNKRIQNKNSNLFKESIYHNNRECVKCDRQQWKPNRTSHCSKCNACIVRMDHHCPWLNNCIGHRNHKSFFLYLFYTFLAQTVYLYQLYRFQGQQVVWDMNRKFQRLLIISSISTSIFYMFVFLLMIYQMYNVMNNRLTLDSFMINDWQYYDQGVVWNILNFMDKSWLMFWMPYKVGSCQNGVDQPVVPSISKYLYKRIQSDDDKLVPIDLTAIYQVNNQYFELSQLVANDD